MEQMSRKPRSPPSSEGQSMTNTSDATFLRRVFILLGVGLLAATLWVLSDIVLLVFGSILVAVILHTLAEPFRRMGVGGSLSVLLSGLGVIGILAGAAIWFGPTLAGELQGLVRTLPEAARRLTGEAPLRSLTELMKESASVSALGGLASRLVAWTSTAAGALASLLLVVFGGIYLALDPRLYRDGFLRLMPSPIRSEVDAALSEAAVALRRWLAGQAVAMLLVGICTGIGLWLVGVPSAAALGLIAGLAEFVPIVGPVLAAIPAILLASTQDVQTVLLAIVVFVVVQQLEGNLITPLVAKNTVAIAPAVALFAVVAMGVLFGPLGLLLSFPLTIVSVVAIRRFYLVDALGEATRTRRNL
jgi:predicted PurR-regulated permease PerM